MDNNYLKGFRNITKQLEKIDFPEARNVSMYITECDKTKLELTDAEIDTAKYIMKLIGGNDNARIHSDSIAKAIRADCAELKMVYDYLMQLGYSNEKLQEFYSKNQSILCYALKEITEQYEYLLKTGLTTEQIKELFLDTIYIGPYSLKERCEVVLKYFDKKMIYILGKQYLFYGYYTDPVDCIEYVVKRLGIEKAEKILREQDMLLYLWKEKYQRNDWTHGPQHREALELIEKYETMV